MVCKHREIYGFCVHRRSYLLFPPRNKAACCSPVVPLLSDDGLCSKLFLTAMMDRLEDDTKKGMGQFTQEEGRVSAQDYLSYS